MTLTSFGIFAISLGLAAIVSWILSRLVKKEGAGCASFIFLSFIFWLALGYFTPTIDVITQNGDELDYSTKYALFSYEGNSISLGHDYIDNQSNDVLVIYPAFYGDASSEFSESSVEIIEAKSFQQIEHSPDEFFYEPKSIVSKKKKGECKWILERASKIQNEYNNKLERAKELLKELLGLPQ